MENTEDIYKLYKQQQLDLFKYYNSRYINLNIDYPRTVSVIMKGMDVPDKLRTSIGVFIANLVALKKQFVLAYPRARSKTIPKQYNKRSISCRKIVEAVDWLIKNEYVLEQRGKPSSVAELRSSSYVWPTEKLLVLFDECTANYLAESYIQNNNPVVLKDKQKYEVDYIDNEFTLTTKDVMQSVNHSNNKHVFKDATGKTLECSTLTRIFSEDWAYGGRLYRTDAQQIKQKDVLPEHSRLGITIDGKSVVEVDYCNLHAMLLCAIEGVHPDRFAGDLYSSVLRHVSVQSRGIPVQETDRSLIKQAFNAMLNSETSGKAMQAIQGIINANGSGYYSFKSGAIVWKLIYECFPEFQKYFDNPNKIGMKLQRADSDMCCIICHRMAMKDKPIIPIHDSFVVLDGDGDLLIHEMARAFKKVTCVQDSWPIFLRVESLYFPTELVVM